MAHDQTRVDHHLVPDRDVAHDLAARPQEDAIADLHPARDVHPRAHDVVAADHGVVRDRRVGSEEVEVPDLDVAGEAAAGRDHVALAEVDPPKVQGGVGVDQVGELEAIGLLDVLGEHRRAHVGAADGNHQVRLLVLLEEPAIVAHDDAQAQVLAHHRRAAADEARELPAVLARVHLFGDHGHLAGQAARADDVEAAAHCGAQLHSRTLETPPG
ncbi:hypothetical protein D3C86_1400090 [compost metagenome]